MSDRRKLIAGAQLAALMLDVGAVPFELRLGPITEAWARAGSSEPEIEAHRRFGLARTSWLAANGIGTDRNQWPETLRHQRRPWSFATLLATHPARVSELLAVAGMPADWRPSYCASVEYGPSRLPPRP